MTNVEAIQAIKNLMDACRNGTFYDDPDNGVFLLAQARLAVCVLDTLQRVRGRT